MCGWWQQCEPALPAYCRFQGVQLADAVGHLTAYDLAQTSVNDAESSNPRLYGLIAWQLASQEDGRMLMKEGR